MVAGRRGKAVGSAGERSETQPGWSRVLSEHRGSLIPAVLAVGTMFRLAGVSRGSSVSALAILRYSGTASVLVATATLVIFLAVAVSGLAAQLVLDSRGRRVRWWVLLLPVLINLSLATTFVLMMTVVSTVVALLHGYAPPELREKVRRPIVPFFDTTVQVATLICVVLIVMAGTILVLSDAMWLPAENVEIADQDGLVGYVLARDGDQTVVLREDDRRVVYVNTDQILARTLCQAGPDNALQVPLLSLVGLTERPRYPRCPED
jgi:uncharacterized membrane protein